MQLPWRRAFWKLILKRYIYLIERISITRWFSIWLLLFPQQYVNDITVQYYLSKVVTKSMKIDLLYLTHIYVNTIIMSFTLTLFISHRSIWDLIIPLTITWRNIILWWRISLWRHGHAMTPIALILSKLKTKTKKPNDSDGLYLHFS